MKVNKVMVNELRRREERYRGSVGDEGRQSVDFSNAYDKIAVASPPDGGRFWLCIFYHI